MKSKLGLLYLLAGTCLWSHPMGNFSVSHYSRLQVTADGLEIRYVLDLAEIPTFQLLQQWKLDEKSPRPELEKKAHDQASDWSRNVHIQAGGRRVQPHLERTSLTLDKGAAGMAVIRITADLKAVAAPGDLRYEDTNFGDRAGWKEIVIVSGEGARIVTKAPPGSDRSQALTAYPADPLATPPQDLVATVKWESTRPGSVTSATPGTAGASGVAPAQSAPGTIVRGDFLSRLLHQGEIGWGMMLAGLAVAFGLGAIHALSPGHGKTIVAAYLVGSRGTPKHALFLGGMVTFTHTISVFALGIVTLFLSQYVLPEKIFPILGAISGISIVWIGATLFFKRLRAARGGHSHHHEHSHSHTHTHSHGGLVHDHGDGHVHSHVPEGDVTLGSLIALGASGGLVPCPSALVLLLSSVALGRVALGLTLLVAFSAGLAVVLSGIGLIVLYARNLLPDRTSAGNNLAFRYLPVASAAVITCAGLIMTGVALGV